MASYDGTMLRLLLINFWPIFVPLVWYVLWMAYRRYRARRKGFYVPRFSEGKWWLPLLLSLLMGIGCFIWLGLQQPANIEAHYTPKYFDGGALNEGKVKP